MGRTEVGKVFHYYSKAGVAAINVTAGELKVGDTVMIEGPSTTLTMVIGSMQVEHQAVEKVTAGQSAGIKVPDRVRAGDRIFKVEP